MWYFAEGTNLGFRDFIFLVNYKSRSTRQQSAGKELGVMAQREAPNLPSMHQLRKTGSCGRRGKSVAQPFIYRRSPAQHSGDFLISDTIASSSSQSESFFNIFPDGLHEMRRS